MEHYYAAYCSIVFEIMKVLLIVIYLWYKLGSIIWICLSIGTAISLVLKVLLIKIARTNIDKAKSTEKKTNILTEYFSNIVNYQMSWLDGFIGDRI